MNLIFATKHWLKRGRWKARRAVVALRWGADRLVETPSVVANAMPKSGSHLINQVVQGLTALGPFVNTGFPPLNRDEANAKLTEAQTLVNIQRMQPGDLAYGYIKARPPFIAPLIEPGRAMVFVYRDPRDMIVSHVFYATQMHPGHGMHHYYNETLHTMEERINAAIQGVGETGSELASIRAKYESYLGWLDQPAVLCLQFEELILERENALNRLLDYLEGRGMQPNQPRPQAVETLKRAIAPQKSGTFRKGQPGNWREHFTTANIACFKEQAGDLLLRLGYETSPDWI